MSQDDTTAGPRQRNTRSFCLFVGLGMLVVAVLSISGLRCHQESIRLQWEAEQQAEQDRWEKQVAEIEAGKTTRMFWPEPRFLENFVTQKPEVAAKVTEVRMFMGKASDERFRFLRQFPHLQVISFYEIWEGADTFLKNISGMQSLTILSFSQTSLSKDGVAAIASFPNLKRLQIDWAWKETDLKPLTGHPSLETLVLDEVPIRKEWIAVMASLPKLREIDFPYRSLNEAELSELRKAVPNAKIRQSEK